ncbi:curli assembly protein CsgG [Barnesiella viscericola DSM 18177]|uniref:Curli assembly protein CsgG n=1 Tax=Barnesiella viscericola DSM 18177 TaxID=880074 RepID=W0EMP4_9BACT|nr:CsgG/HfaB family protein [Barnesiella viscericola]AHF12052.1 curli assembly protein CsgG [Barnesiella viscericola DSM 18177]
MKRCFWILMMFVCGTCVYAQISSDIRPVVGVAQFTSETDSKYAGLVTEKVVEMLTNTKRFQVVDRTSHDKIKEELELQKSEAFLDSKNLVEQDIAVAAEKLITGHINKIPIYAMKNANGSIKGYKGSVSFQMKVVDVATGLSTEAVSFEGKASDLMLSPESAVNQAMQSLQDEIYEYFKKNFPVSGKIIKVLKEKKDKVEVVLLNVGKKQGVNQGDRFAVQYVEMLDGEPYPVDLGEIEVVKLSGEAFSECKVPSKMGEELASRLASNANIVCKMIIK